MTTSRFAGSKLAKGFLTDKGAENNGVWRFHADSGILAKIRRSTLPEHKRALRKHYRPFANMTRIDPTDEQRVKMKAAAEILVADWAIAILDDLGQPKKNPDGTFQTEPLVDGQENPILATQDTILEAFTEMPDFFQWVTEEADTFEHYRVEAVQASGGNSPPSSAGNGSGAPLEQPPSLSAEQLAESLSRPSSANLS